MPHGALNHMVMPYWTWEEQTEKMPHSCSAWNCTNRFTVQARSNGITFHRFPKNKELRKRWQTAAKREEISASPSFMLCSEHFRPEDFDRTGQTVRIRDGAVPSVFSFPAHLRKGPSLPVATSVSQTSQKMACKTPPLDSSQSVQETKSLPIPSADHAYALPSTHDLRARLMKALDRVERLERELRNVKDRERRAKNTVSGLLEDLRVKKLINEELKEQLDIYSDLPTHLLSKQSHEYTKDQKDFAITLHSHGPKAYSYLRETLNINLPHPHTLQRWMTSKDAKGDDVMPQDALT
uniref:THAP domain-containing protein 6-like n=1 Tax=Doryrhamphus excisus TaxID=161450 RepID=UPI0025AE9EFF|nr:THAP domain-containing protein 6-like [Doryrhamphus excisus]XP_057923261.1 THAP domain-containing protein 6-like [Doryrhamphus excisus]XP_057923262.1 THAP domain-containing protein 6-like [Doryrhamphus excisus]XP_057923263.1 THAP domain-containing protein 6-like [Doryrhamphus excisus]